MTCAFKAALTDWDCIDVLIDTLILLLKLPLSSPVASLNTTCGHTQCLTFHVYHEFIISRVRVKTSLVDVLPWAFLYDAKFRTIPILELIM